MKYSTGVIIVQKTDVESEFEFLCVRAYALWDFPKGEMDPKETLHTTAIREVKEETSLDNDIDFKMTNLVIPSIVYGSGKKKKTATYFLAHRTSSTEPFLPINPELGKPEHEEYRWVPLSVLRETMPKRFGPIIDFLENLYKNKSTL
jgi:8-oxo-dGTP pyrophosphatase MutT (NUDIX family)